MGYAVLVLVQSYLATIVFVVAGLSEKGGNFLSYLTNFTATTVTLYSIVSALPLLCPTLREVQWDALFHPRGRVRQILYHIAVTSTLYLTVVFWLVLGMHPQDAYPEWAKVWSLLDNIGVHGSNVVWLLLDGLLFDRGLARSYRSRHSMWYSVSFGLVYFAIVMGQGAVTGVYPYPFFYPGRWERPYFFGGTVLMCVISHHVISALFRVQDRVWPIPSGDTTPHYEEEPRPYATPLASAAVSQESMFCGRTPTVSKGSISKSNPHGPEGIDLSALAEHMGDVEEEMWGEEGEEGERPVPQVTSPAVGVVSALDRWSRSVRVSRR
ncbi:FAR-17a/AIG1-like protein [Kipferlia bialata]|uniref:FAR-17a/AIG1-like protein n=1 Tax=Kipferlia bialata TaxID=797122 RepID=A0A9K3GPG1_9EUKA|nr:FAR-17a/AIG1-like protein [Kipferlia bialata]|eukprot:g12331.t1